MEPDRQTIPGVICSTFPFGDTSILAPEHPKDLPDRADIAPVGSHLLATYKEGFGHWINWYMPIWKPSMIESFFCESIEDAVGALSTIRSGIQQIAARSLTRIIHPTDLFPNGARKGFNAVRTPLETLLATSLTADNIYGLVGDQLFLACDGHWQQHSSDRFRLPINGAEHGSLVARYEDSRTGRFIRYRVQYFPVGAHKIDSKGFDAVAQRTDGDVKRFLLCHYAQSVFKFLRSQRGTWGYFPL